MRSTASFGMHQDNYLTIEAPESHQSLLAVYLANVFTRYREVAPYGLAAEKIKAVCFEISLPLPLVPCDHLLIVVTNN